jgi:hypothetical protein
MSDFQDYHCFDVPVAPAHQSGIIKDRRRPGRVHDASPALVPLLRKPASMGVVDDIVHMPGAAEVARQGTRRFGGSLGVGIFTAATVWFLTGHGSSIALAAVKMLRFLYGIGLLM